MCTKGSAGVLRDAWLQSRAGGIGARKTESAAILEIPPTPVTAARCVDLHHRARLSHRDVFRHDARSRSAHLEGKDPASGFALAAIYLPSDAHDVAHATGAKYQIRLFTSDELSRTVPTSGGKIYVECAGPHPSRECDTMEIGAGNP